MLNNNIDLRDEIISVIYVGQYTCINWKDGSWTCSKCSDSDEYDSYNGFLAAVAKKYFGSTHQIKDVIHEKNMANMATILAENQIRRERKAKYVKDSVVKQKVGLKPVEKKPEVKDRKPDTPHPSQKDLQDPILDVLEILLGIPRSSGSKKE